MIDCSRTGDHESGDLIGAKIVPLHQREWTATNSVWEYATGILTVPVQTTTRSLLVLLLLVVVVLRLPVPQCHSEYGVADGVVWIMMIFNS